MSLSASTAARDRLRVAIQRNGRLGAPSRALLAACGFAWREERDRLMCLGEAHAIDLLLVRDDDIASLIADGICDFGIVGRNVLAEEAARREAAGAADAPIELRALGCGRCCLDIAVPVEWDFREASALDGLRKNLLALQATAIVADFNDDAAGVVIGVEGDGTHRRLAGGRANLGGLDAMVDRITNEMGKRIGDPLNDGLIELRVLAADDELNLLSELP